MQEREWVDELCFSLFAAQEEFLERSLSLDICQKDSAKIRVLAKDLNLRLGGILFNLRKHSSFSLLNPFDRIPIELMSEIFSFCDIRCLRRLPSVSKRFRQVLSLELPWKL